MYVHVFFKNTWAFINNLCFLTTFFRQITDHGNLEAYSILIFGLVDYLFKRLLNSLSSKLNSMDFRVVINDTTVQIQ